MCAAITLMALLVGCGIQPTGVVDGGEAPTGLAPGVTLYFVDAEDELQAQPRDGGRLGTISEALSWLLVGPGGSDMRTELPADSTTNVVVTTSDDVIELRVPLATYEVTPTGIDQIVCTALAAHVQAGGSTRTAVRIHFTDAIPGSDRRRNCPLIG